MPIKRVMEESFFELLHVAEAVEPSIDMTTYDILTDTGTFEVGTRFASHGTDPDEDPAFEIFLSCAPYVHPPDDQMAAYRFSASEQGRDILWFWAGGQRKESLSQRPIVLPADRDSAEYADAVSEYVERARAQLREWTDRIIERLANG